MPVPVPYIRRTADSAAANAVLVGLFNDCCNCCCTLYGKCRNCNGNDNDADADADGLPSVDRLLLLPDN
jgi:hypothetical protein